VEEGVVGAGAGTVAFGFKGGIGTASRKLPDSLGGWTLGVFVQTNYGGVLTIQGVPVGVRLGKYELREQVEKHKGDGSVVIVVATDAPVSDRNLQRIAERAFAGIARTGSGFTNGSGDYAVAFSTNADVRRTAARRTANTAYPEIPNDQMSPLFLAVAEATEEAALDSLFTAHKVAGNLGTVEALPLDRVLPMLKGR
jgi:D-aminopeptidase